MNKPCVNTILVISFTLSINACTMTHKSNTDVIVGSGTMYEVWKISILEKCSDKALEVTAKIVSDKIKEGYVFTQEDVINIHSFLVKKCSLNSGIVI